jgi:hypothetical protein
LFRAREDAGFPPEPGGNGGSVPQQTSISKNISTEVKPTINSTLALCGMMEWYLTPTDKDDLFKFFYGPELLTWISVPGQVL